MKHQHDDLANEQNAARAHNAMKWMYRGQNLVLLAVAGAIVAAPKRDRRDHAITAVAVGAIGFAVWINSESAQWHARATDEHRGRATKLMPESGFPDVEEHAAKRNPRRLNLDPAKARGAHA